MICEATGESLTVDEGGLDEEVAPEEDISTDIHSNPIPLHDKSQRSIESRTERHATRHASPITVPFHRVISIRQMNSYFIILHLKVF